MAVPFVHLLTLVNHTTPVLTAACGRQPSLIRDAWHVLPAEVTCVQCLAHKDRAVDPRDLLLRALLVASPDGPVWWRAMHLAQGLIAGTPARPFYAPAAGRPEGPAAETSPHGSNGQPADGVAVVEGVSGAGRPPSSGDPTTGG